MEDMNKIEMACFEIIANVGSARSCFIEAIDLAGEGKIDEAEARVAEGEQFFLVGHANDRPTSCRNAMAPQPKSVAGPSRYGPGANYQCAMRPGR